MTILRVCTVHRISQEDNKLRMGEKLCNSSRCMRMREVARTCLSCYERLLISALDIVLFYHSRKVRFVPPQTSLVLILEIMNLLCRRLTDIRMLHEIVVKGCCSTFLRTNNKKIGHQSYGTGQCPIKISCIFCNLLYFHTHKLLVIARSIDSLPSLLHPHRLRHRRSLFKCW